MKLLNPNRHQLHKQKGTKIIYSGLLLVVDARIWVGSGCLNNVVGPTWKTRTARSTVGQRAPTPKRGV